MSSNPLAYFEVKPSEVVKAVKAILTGAIPIPQDMKFSIEGTRAVFMIPTPPLSEEFPYLLRSHQPRRREKLRAFAYVVRDQWLKVWPVMPVTEGGPIDRLAFIREEMSNIMNQVPLVTAAHVVQNVSAQSKDKREPYGALPSWVDWCKMLFDCRNASSCHIWPMHQLPPRRSIEVLGDFPSEIPPVPVEPYLDIGPNIQLTLPNP
ncbi:hypothetical protein BT96DRAFT_996223 [Gymnopus androsaceus JB14]|uniref:Uncharacterized protein n=1 Tax=Gymnopus androsaceus JB14 TaxID=1447944 RepID=A0A6A4HHA6_9AGAR|nr:hypothetical protein BT96DRAFT_996223 [Gymnopus androsaceus JB14]